MATNSSVALISPHDTQAEVFDCVECDVGLGFYAHLHNNVYLCGTTLQELDAKKTVPGEIGYNARECCRILDELRETGDLTKGVRLKTSNDPAKCGKLYIEREGAAQSYLPEGYSIKTRSVAEYPIHRNYVPHG